MEEDLPQFARERQVCGGHEVAMAAGASGDSSCGKIGLLGYVLRPTGCERKRNIRILHLYVVS